MPGGLTSKEQGPGVQILGAFVESGCSILNLEDTTGHSDRTHVGLEPGFSVLDLEASVQLFQFTTPPSEPNIQSRTSLNDNLELVRDILHLTFLSRQ